MKHLPGMKRHVANAVEEDNSILTRFLKDQFEKLIQEGCIKTKVIRSKIIIVIDALDECEGLHERQGLDERQREASMKLILSSLRKLEALKLEFRILITSRPETPIRLGFSTLPGHIHRDVSLHHIQESTIEDDIYSFFKARLEEIRDDAVALGRKIPIRWPQDQDIKKLVKISAPLFISAATVCNFLAATRKDPHKQLEIVLRNRRAGQSSIYEIYSSILKQLINPTETDENNEIVRNFQDIVGTIILLEFPLSQDSLSNLLYLRSDEHLPSYQTDEISLTLQELHSVLNIPRETDSPIQILHLSFREFLTTPDTKEIADSQKIQALGLLPLVHDIERFIRYNCMMVAIAPLQIYSSALILSPKRSKTREIYSKYIPKWIKSGPAVEDTWSACLQVLEGLKDSEGDLGTGATTVAFSPESRLAASGDVGGSIRLWDTATGQGQVLEGHKDCVTCVKFSPDGALIASSSDDETVRLWDITTGQSQLLEGHQWGVNIIAFSPDGALVASGSNDGTVRLWDVITGQSQILTGHQKTINSVVFSPDGKLIASGSYDQTVRLWDRATGRCTQVLEGHSDSVETVAFSTDGTLIVSRSSDDTARLWDKEIGQCIWVLELVFDMVLSPDGRLIASASAAGEDVVQLWDTANKQCTRVLEGHSDEVKTIMFSPDGKLIASASYDDTVRLWNVETGQCVQTLGYLEGSTIAIAFSPDSTLIACGSYGGTVRLWDTTIQDNQVMDGHPDLVDFVALSPSGALIASIAGGQTVRLWSTATGRCINVLAKNSYQISIMVFSPNSNLLAFACNDKAVRLWDMISGVWDLNGHLDHISAVTFSPDSTLAASASDDSTVRLWDTATVLGTARILEGHSDSVRGIAFSPDGTLIASGSKDHTLRLWDINTGECIQIISDIDDIPGWKSLLTFSPDGQLIARKYDSKKIWLWDKATKQARILEGHLDTITAIAFSSGGKIIISASSDATVRFWDTDTGRCFYLDEYVESVISLHRISGPYQYCLEHLEKTSFPKQPRRCRLADGGYIYAALSVNWFSIDGERLLYLPSDYSYDCGTFTQDGVIVFGSVAGQLYFVSLDMDHLHNRFLASSLKNRSTQKRTNKLGTNTHSLRPTITNNRWSRKPRYPQ
ncbi:Beta-TrCP [Dactylellina cionopaga]|nr:Beta-TrCP [Dactylellina cionopaga]